MNDEQKIRSAFIAHRSSFALYASSSIGRAAVSKAAGWGFDSLLACVRVKSEGSVADAVRSRREAHGQRRRSCHRR